MQTESVGPYIITSMILNESKYVIGGDFSFGKKQDGCLERFAIKDINNDGTVSIQPQLSFGWDPRESYCKPEEVMAEMLKSVNK